MKQTAKYYVCIANTHNDTSECGFASTNLTAALAIVSENTYSPSPTVVAIGTYFGQIDYSSSTHISASQIAIAICTYVARTDCNRYQCIYISASLNRLLPSLAQLWNELL
jgi:hypothetical protein